MLDGDWPDLLDPLMQECGRNVDRSRKVRLFDGGVAEVIFEVHGAIIALLVGMSIATLVALINSIAILTQ